MPEKVQDQWAEWLLRRRSGGDPARMRAHLQQLYRVRDRVLQNAQLKPGDVLLDVGAGDGLIAFGALEHLGAQGRVIFSDISQDLLDHSRALAAEIGVLTQCQFLRAFADDLTGVADASVDAVTTRSVLIYVDAKDTAFAEFYRVLRPGGRLSIFEPINRFMAPDHSGSRLFGQDVTPVQEIADKVRAVFDRYQSPDTDPMVNFDERDLLQTAANAGFTEIHLAYEADIKPGGWWGTDWDALLQTAGNPKIPTLGEAIEQALTPAEAQQFQAYMRPRIETGAGTSRMAVAYLWAVK